MSSRKRILTTLEHKEPDRVPLDLGGVAITGIHTKAYQNLLSLIGIDEKIEVLRVRPQVAKISRQVLNILEVDTRGIFTKEAQDPKGEIQIEEKGSRLYIDEFGTSWKMSPSSPFFEMETPMLERSKTQSLEDFAWPDPRNITDWTSIREEATQFKEEQKFVIAGNTCTLGIFAPIPRLIGYEKFFKNLVQDPPFICKIMDKLTEIEIAYFETLLENAGDLIDCVVEFDDLGGQNGPLISPEMYRKYVKPRHRKLFSFIKEKTQNSTYLFFHSDGSVYEFIPDLIQLGVDILNPVQYKTAKMETKRLKREFGKHMTFWGGGVDPQKILPFGNPQDVKDETKRIIENLAPGGGFVFSPIHNIQPDVPPQNIKAMYDALRKYGEY